MTRTTAELMAFAEDLYYDLDFKSVKRWKVKTGGHAIGFMPVYAPREIVHAAGAMPVGIVGAGDWLEVIRGDAYYQSYLCHIPRSTIDMAESGRLDFLEGMLFPSTCDVIRNLSGMWQIVKPDMYTRYVDVPQNFTDGVGGQFWAHELRTLAQELGERTGTEVTDERLRASIALFNENRRAVCDLYSLRRDEPARAPTSEVYLMVRAGLVMDVEDHTALIREYITAARNITPPELDNARVIVVGAFCEQPPIGLIKSIERSGCFVVDDDLILISRWFTDNAAETGDPIEALALAFVHDSVPTAVMYSAKAGRGKAVVERVRVARAEGVIFAAPSFCTPALLDQPMLVAELDREGIPYTAFKFAENAGQFQPIREQTGTFADTMKLWSVA